jgi:peptidyl-prolyl cis-trans isomerase C
MKRTNWIERIACAALSGAALWASAGTGAAQPAKAMAEKPSASLTKPAATVNGEAITFGQLEPILKAVGPIPVELPEAQRREMQREALSMLIDDLLLQQFLRKNAPAVNPAEIDKKMAELAAGLKNKDKTLQDFYKETGQSEGDLRTNLSNVLAWSGYADKRVTEAEVRKYYDTYKDFFDKVTVRASHICLRVPADAADKDRAAARTKLLDLRAQIAAGKLDFAEAAKRHSQCPTGPGGGDIGSFPRKFVVDENFARAAYALKVGEVSDVVQTDFGLHVIKVTERKPGQPSDFAKIKEEVKDFYLEELRHQILVQLRKEAKIEIHLP